jgi:hypothetical protein
MVEHNCQRMAMLQLSVQGQVLFRQSHKHQHNDLVSGKQMVYTNLLERTLARPRRWDNDTIRLDVRNTNDYNERCLQLAQCQQC